MNETLRKHISEEIMLIGQQVLDYADVAITDREQYLRYRAKVLRIVNTAVRNLEKYIDNEEITP